MTVALTAGGMRTTSSAGPVPSAPRVFTYSLSQSRSALLPPRQQQQQQQQQQHTLYIPLTSYCNSLTLPQTRGPNFVLPPDVVAALCRVRDAECSSGSISDGISFKEPPKWQHWCQWLDWQDSPQKLPPPAKSNYVACIPRTSTTGNCDEESPHRPTVAELVYEVESFIRFAQQPNDDADWTFVIGGEGEPTLRPDALVELIQRLHSLRLQCRGSKRLRITTNGLMSPHDARRLFAAVATCHDAEDDMEDAMDDSATRLRHITWSVALMTHDTHMYNQLMQPLLLLLPLQDDDTEPQSQPHAYVTSFIRCALAEGFTVETTAVDRSEDDDPTTRVSTTKAATNELSAALGVQPAVRWRKYFP